MRRISMAIACLGLLAVAVGGCGEEEPASTTTPGSGPLVSYEKSGGVAGVLERLTVDRDGSATLEVGYQDPATRSFLLSASELARLEDELETADFDGFQHDGPSACADCFVFDIRYGDRGIEFDESEHPPDSVSAVVSHLGSIVEAHYPSTASGPG